MEKRGSIRALACRMRRPVSFRRLICCGLERISTEPRRISNDLRHTFSTRASKTTREGACAPPRSSCIPQCVQIPEVSPVGTTKEMGWARIGRVGKVFSACWLPRSDRDRSDRAGTQAGSMLPAGSYVLNREQESGLVKNSVISSPATISNPVVFPASFISSISYIKCY